MYALQFVDTPYIDNATESQNVCMRGTSGLDTTTHILFTALITFLIAFMGGSLAGAFVNHCILKWLWKQSPKS